MPLPPLAILIPRVIRLLELLVDVYGIVAPCVGCALRGCCGGGCCTDKEKKEKEGDDGCECPARPVDGRKPREQEEQEYMRKGKEEWRKGCFSWRKSKGEEKKRRKRLHKDPPPGFFEQHRATDAGEDAETDHELAALQRQYSTLPQPPPPPTTGSA